MSSSMQLNHPGGGPPSGTPFNSLPVDTKAHTFVPPKYKEAEKPNFLQSIIQRGRIPIGENTF